MNSVNKNTKQTVVKEDNEGFTDVDLRRYNESKSHMRGKMRMRQILEEHDNEVEYEKSLPCIDPDTGITYHYFTDVYAKNRVTGRVICVEVDGKIGHSSVAKRDFRDKLIMQTYKEIQRIYHYATAWIVGKKKLDQKDFEFEMGLTSSTNDVAVMLAD